MTTVVVPDLEPDLETGDRHTQHLLAAIDATFAAEVSWDVRDRVLVFRPDHPTLGWNPCSVAECNNRCDSATTTLCHGCYQRWLRANKPEVDGFVQSPRPTRGIHTPVESCTVSGCQRPWRSRHVALCCAHQSQQRDLGITVEEFRHHPDVVPHPSTGPCLVAACTRDRAGRGGYCVAHYQRWNTARKRDPQIDEGRWRRLASAVSEKNRLSLRGLPLRVVAEFVYGLQQRCRAGIKTRYNNLKPLIDQARLLDVRSLTEVPEAGLNKRIRGIRNQMVADLELFAATPETERHKDEWNTAMFGHSGTLRFTGISQPWLKYAAKSWALDTLPRRRGRRVIGSLQHRLDALCRLSESLQLQRSDRGEHPGILGRADITAFCNRLAYLHAQGTITAMTRYKHALDARAILVRMRSIGLAEPGEPLHGLPAGFALTRDDIPARPEQRQQGRDLPLEVVRELCGHLDAVTGRHPTEVRVAIELLIDTGRRPEEICRLSWDCLDRDADGKPVLVYDNRKANRLGRRLPISETTAHTILAQQTVVRDRFPTTPVTELALLPSPMRNTTGARSIGSSWVSGQHRQWVDSLPEITVPTSVDVDGQPVTQMLPFDKQKIFLQAYRHTFAQRYADSGIRPDVLQDLMDHTDLATTQQYYRVSEHRRRQAVEQVTTMQFDRHGNRIWREAEALLDTEHARRAVGETAVPYGVCTEPGNVAAGGNDCPIRFRCVGCGHFRTDVSYLPDLEAYLADLIRNRERLLATVNADSWATAEAMPSTDEITRVRTLINRIHDDVDNLTDDEQAHVQQAVATVRQARNTVVSLGLPRIRQPLPDIRSEDTA